MSSKLRNPSLAKVAGCGARWVFTSWIASQNAEGLLPSPNLGRIAAEKKRARRLVRVWRPQPARWCVGASRLFESFLPFQGKSIGFWAMARRKKAPDLCGSATTSSPTLAAFAGRAQGRGAAGGEWVLTASVLLGSRFCDANSMPYDLGKVRSDDFFWREGWQT